jgi:glycosyltransferase involved in cell wall biosynthesis
MRFSIVTPSYQQASFIQQALRSVAEQGVPVQHIVMDGGSTDGTKEILGNFEPRLHTWVSRPDRGQTDALNQGVALSEGDVVGWINSDDFYLPGALQAVQERFEGPDRPDVVFGNMVEVDGRGAFLREHRHDDASLESLLVLGTDLSQQALFWRRELSARVFPLSVDLRFAMDFQLFCRLALATTRFARIDRFLGAFRIHGATKSSKMADVGRREHGQIVQELTASVGHGYRKPRLWMAARRRLRLARRGDVRYALLGGRVGAQPATRRLVQSAEAWCTRRGE